MQISSLYEAARKSMDISQGLRVFEATTNYLELCKHQACIKDLMIF